MASPFGAMIAPGARAEAGRWALSEEDVMLPWKGELAGRIDEHVFTSELLKGNPLGDSRDRPLLVYTPPGYDDEPDKR